ncbi:hypothetical protein [Thalassomonas actiniarum]|uniref:Uncharacterized protein n=1 Tax=Thalassomonas actiniarum TaxID=485447 RepID=A0AAF0C465_9GAMM|nr:hypothetical protein [Thalassomonas actiniarum]WDD99608.1 hypothetical protein SG35_002730 [Thalassomonas actiniarum]
MKLYRGVSEQVPDGIQDNPYIVLPRQPRNSDQNVHEVADEWFAQDFKIRARSQTIFCSTDIEQAKEYSGDYGYLLEITIPDGKACTLIFSEEVNDFLEIEIDISDTKDEQQITNWLQSKAYQSVHKPDDLPKGFEGEVMLYCEQYEVRNI